MNRQHQTPSWKLFLALPLLLFLTVGETAGEPAGEKVELRLWYLPELVTASPHSLAEMRVIESYQKEHSEVLLRKSSGIKIPQIGAGATVLMSIAGGVAPDVATGLLASGLLYEALENLSFVRCGFRQVP